MASKLGRNYSLTIEASNGQILPPITPPFSMEFDITRNAFSSANVASLRIYNLGKEVRDLIRKDRYDFSVLRKVALLGGYQDNLAVMLSGNIVQAWSVREGNNIVTQIEAFDAGFAFANAVIKKQYPANTAQKHILEDMIESLKAYGVERGIVGDFGGIIARGNSYTGSTTNLLQELTGGAFFIDNGKAHCLKDNEVFDDGGNTPVISSASGLLGTPIREETYVNFDMIFEPNLKIGQRVKLDSITGDDFNKTYKVISLHHKGIISEAVAGTAITSVGLFAGNFKSVSANG